MQGRLIIVYLMLRIPARHGGATLLFRPSHSLSATICNNPSHHKIWTGKAIISAFIAPSHFLFDIWRPTPMATSTSAANDESEPCGI
jgi:hypothetical protein